MHIHIDINTLLFYSHPLITHTLTHSASGRFELRRAASNSTLQYALGRMEKWATGLKGENSSILAWLPGCLPAGMAFIFHPQSGTWPNAFCSLSRYRGQCRSLNIYVSAPFYEKYFAIAAQVFCFYYYWNRPSKRAYAKRVAKWFPLPALPAFRAPWQWKHCAHGPRTWGRAGGRWKEFTSLFSSSAIVDNETASQMHCKSSELYRNSRCVRE